MLIDDIGHPLDLSKSLNCSNSVIKKYVNASLLIGSAVEPVEHLNFLKEWQGNIYTSATIWDMQKQYLHMRIDAHRICIMKPNVSVKKENMEITMIPMGPEDSEDTILFVIKDEFTTRLYIDCEVNCLDAFIVNSVLREAIQSGVDAVHINTESFTKEAVDENGDSKCLLDSLLYLIRPKYAFSECETVICENLWPSTEYS